MKSARSFENFPEYYTISVGDTFKPYVWKARYDMDFRSECLYCDNEALKGYHVVGMQEETMRIAVCPQCDKVNTKY